MPLNLLVIEDNEDDQQLIARALQLHFTLPLEIGFAADEIELWKELKRTCWHAVVCDYVLPTIPWPAALRICRSVDRDIAFMVVSGAISDDKGAEAIRAGADDYLDKACLDELGVRVEKIIQHRNLTRQFFQVATREHH